MDNRKKVEVLETEYVRNVLLHNNYPSRLDNNLKDETELWGTASKADFGSMAIKNKL